MLIHSAEITGSVQFNNTDVSGITNVSSFATTASVDALVVKTGSFATTSSVNELQSKTGSYATTSSVNELQSKTGSFTSTSSFDAYSSSINTFTSSAATRLNTIESVTGSYASTSSVNNLQSVTGSYATTGSNQFNGNQSISGSITSNGIITAQTLVVQTVTSSIEFVTGSTRNGSLLTHTHEFTGSVFMSGSLGIGTSSPNGRLAVNTGGSNQIAFFNNSTSGGTYNIISLNGSYSEGTNMSIQGGGVGDANLYVNSGYTSSTSGDIIFRSGGASIYTERMRITSVGNVGIGTSSPINFTNQTSLSVNGTGVSRIDMFVSGTRKGGLVSAGDATYLEADTAIPLIFNTNGSERMRINSSGTIVMPANQLTPSINISGLILQGYANNNSWISDNLYYSNNSSAFLRAAAGFVAQIYFAGGQIQTYTAGNDSAGTTATRTTGPYIVNGGTSWSAGSDIRKKKNFETTQGLAEILQIEPVKYNLKTDEDGATKRLGFKAQNLQTLIPEMVMETSEKAEDGSNYLGLTHDYILPVLVKAIQELKAEIDILKQQ
jgi:hypothetical protein